MSDQSDRGAPMTARVIEIDAPDDLASLRALPPRVILTERTEPVTPTERAVVPRVTDVPARRRTPLFFIDIRVAVSFGARAHGRFNGQSVLAQAFVLRVFTQKSPGVVSRWQSWHRVLPN